MWRAGSSAPLVIFFLRLLSAKRGGDASTTSWGFFVVGCYPLATAAGRRFDDDRIAHFFGDLLGFRQVLDDFIAAREDIQAGSLHLLPGQAFIAHQLNHSRLRADENKPG